MPNIANITVKKNDGTTDQIWTAIRGSQGPTVPAIWRNTAPGNALSHKPEFWMSSQTSQGTGRVQTVKLTAKWSQIATNTTTGVTSTVNKPARFKGSFDLPEDMATSDRDEFVSQVTNVVASALVKACLKEGDAAV